MRRKIRETVWYDAGTGRLRLTADNYQNSVPLAQIPDADFESAAAISRS